MNPDPETAPLEHAVAHDGAGRGGVDEDAGVGRADVFAALANRDPLHLRTGRRENDGSPHATPVENGSLSAQDDGSVDLGGPLMDTVGEA